MNRYSGGPIPIILGIGFILGILLLIFLAWPRTMTSVVEAKYWAHHTHRQRWETDTTCTHNPSTKQTECTTHSSWVTKETKTLHGKDKEYPEYPTLITTRKNERIVHEATFSILLGTGDTANIWTRQTYNNLSPGQEVEVRYNYLGKKWLR